MIHQADLTFNIANISLDRPCEVAIVIVLVAETDRGGTVAAAVVDTAGVDGGHENGGESDEHVEKRCTHVRLSLLHDVTFPSRGICNNHEAERDN